MLISSPFHPSHFTLHHSKIMPASAKPVPDSNLVEIYVTGKLSIEDYHQFVPIIDAKIEENGTANLLFFLADFHGWELAALWEDAKFDISHYRKIERIAFIGETAWEKGLTRFCKPFSGAVFKYFELGAEDTARDWLETGAEVIEGDDLTVVHRVKDAMQAEIIAIALRREGIFCQVADFNQGGYTGMNPAEILVKNSDFDRATAFIEEHEGGK